MAGLIEKTIAFLFEGEGTILVPCGQCGKEYYVAKECVEQNGRISAEGLFGAYLSPERFLYCNQKCWANFCED